MLTWRCRVADLILAADDGAVRQLSAKRDALLCAYCRQHYGALCMKWGDPQQKPLIKGIRRSTLSLGS